MDKKNSNAIHDLVNDISYAALERLAENKAGWKHKEKGCRESAGQQKSTRRRKDGFYAYVDGHSSTRRISTSVAAAGPPGALSFQRLRRVAGIFHSAAE